MSSSLPTHGTLIQYNGVGVYLIGKSGIGKSEIALSLIDQGGILICDDGPEFTTKPDNDGLVGTCPEKFYGLIHIRELGVINLTELYGQQVFKASSSVDFIIELIRPVGNNIAEIKLKPEYHNWHFYHWTISGIRLQLYPGRNVPTLIKTAVKQFSKQHQSNQSK